MFCRKTSNLTSLILYLHDLENWNKQSQFLIPTKASVVNLGTELIRRLFDDQDVPGIEPQNARDPQYQQEPSKFRGQALWEA